MDPQWEDSVPIYRQLRDRVVAMILDGILKEGDALPSVRSVASEFRLNPLNGRTAPRTVVPGRASAARKQTLKYGDSPPPPAANRGFHPASTA